MIVDTLLSTELSDFVVEIGFLVKAILHDGRLVSGIVVESFQTLEIVQITDAQLFGATLVDELLAFPIDFHRRFMGSFGSVQDERIDIVCLQIDEGGGKGLTHLFTQGRPRIVG